MEVGYSKYQNPYHNLIHAADVLQTTYQIIYSSGLMVEVNTLSIVSSHSCAVDRAKATAPVELLSPCGEYVRQEAYRVVSPLHIRTPPTAMRRARATHRLLFPSH